MSAFANDTGMRAAAIAQILCPSDETDTHGLGQIALPASSRALSAQRSVVG